MLLRWQCRSWCSSTLRKPLVLWNRAEDNRASERAVAGEHWTSGTAPGAALNAVLRRRHRQQVPTEAQQAKTAQNSAPRAAAKAICGPSPWLVDETTVSAASHAATALDRGSYSIR